MADNGFDGTKFEYPVGTGLKPLRSCEYSESVAKVDVTGSTDTGKKYVAGIKDPTLTVTIVGTATGVAVGTNSTLGGTITWNDGAISTLSNCLPVSKSITGDIDGEITTTIEFAPQGSTAA